MCIEFRGYKGIWARVEGVKESSDVRNFSKKESGENGEALQTEMNAMDCSQRENGGKEGTEMERERESIREKGKLVCNGFSQWDGCERERRRGRATRRTREINTTDWRSFRQKLRQKKRKKKR